MRSVWLGGVVAGMLALNLLGGPAMAAAPAAPPKPRDVTAARAVVHALDRFDETALHREGEMTAAARALVAQVQAGCAGVIPSSIANGTDKQQGVFLDLILESAFDLTVRAIHPLDHAAVALTRGFDRVHFSKRAFTRRIHDTAKAQQLLLAITPSDLCADAKVAAAGGFAADAPGTTAFINGILRLNPGPTDSVPEIIKTVKADLVTERDLAALKQLQKVDARYQKFSTNLGLQWGAKLGKVLTSAPPAGGTGGTGGFPTNPPPPSTARDAMTAAFATF